MPLRIRLDPVAVLAAGLGLWALGLGWLELKPSRIALGSVHGVWDWGWGPLLLGALWVLLALLPRGGGLWLAGATLLWGGLTKVGSEVLLSGQGEVARVSLAAGFWLSLLALYIGYFAAYRLSGPKVGWGLGLALALLGGWGAFAQLGPTQEFMSWQPQFWIELQRHLALSFTAVLLALAVGLPLGVLAAGGRAGWILAGVGFLQTIPSLALFGLVLPVLAAISQSWRLETVLAVLFIGALALRPFAAVSRTLALAVGLPLVGMGLIVGGVWLNQLLGPEPLKVVLGGALEASGIRGMGTAPAVLALTLYALLPIVQNVYAGLRNVGEGVRDAGRGMGMNPQELFWRVELPLALPLVMEGVRGAASLAIGIATVAALIGAGGLGFFILRGVEGGAPDMVLLGALPVLGLALAVDLGLRWLAQRLRQRVGL